MPVEIEGVRQYTYTTLKGAVGVDAETGKPLWHFPWKLNTAVTTTPLPLGDGKLLLTAGYHTQTVIFQVKRDGEDWTTEEVLSLPPPTTGWNSEVQTPIVYRDRIYGVGKKQRGLWTCLDLSGNELWTSERQASFELGGYVLADGMFFVLEGKTGVLRILDANADHYEELGHFQLLEGPDVWAPPVVSHGRLLIRDLRKLICLDISSAGSSVAPSSTAAIPP
jgi:outer membrane protein assembly factor BamB